MPDAVRLHKSACTDGAAPFGLPRSFPGLTEEKPPGKEGFPAAGPRRLRMAGCQCSSGSCTAAVLRGPGSRTGRAWGGSGTGGAAPVEGVDDHLGVRRPRDLDAAVLQIRRQRGHLPVALPHLHCVAPGGLNFYFTHRAHPRVSRSRRCNGGCSIEDGAVDSRDAASRDRFLRGLHGGAWRGI